MRSIAVALLTVVALARSARADDAPPAPPAPAAAEAPPVGKAALVVLVAPVVPGVQASLDGAPIGDLSRPLFVDPGAHRVEVWAHGYFREGRNVSVAAAERAKLEFTLTLKDPEPAPAPDAGGSKVAIAAPSGTLQRTIGIVLLGTGVLAGSAAAVTGGVYEWTRSRLQGLIDSGRCARSEGGTVTCGTGVDYDEADELDDEATDLVIATAALGAGAAFFLAIGVAVTVTVPSDPAKAVRLEPWVGPGTAGLQVTRRW